MDRLDVEFYSHQRSLLIADCDSDQKLISCRAQFPAVVSAKKEPVVSSYACMDLRMLNGTDCTKVSASDNIVPQPNRKPNQSYTDAPMADVSTAPTLPIHWKKAKQQHHEQQEISENVNDSEITNNGNRSPSAKESHLEYIKKEINELFNLAYVKYGAEFVCMMHVKESSNTFSFGTPAAVDFLSSNGNLEEQFKRHVQYLTTGVSSPQPPENWPDDDDQNESTGPGKVLSFAGGSKRSEIGAEEDSENDTKEDIAIYHEAADVVGDDSETDTEYIVTGYDLKEANIDICQTVEDTVIRHQICDQDDARFICEYCSRRFDKKSLLDKHLRTHTGERPFKCEHCGKSFTRRDHLREHAITHTAVKPHACDYCSRTFAQKITLTIHMRTHTGEKPFQCDYCMKTFAHRHPWLRHLSKHTVEKPLVCRYCNEEFQRQSALNRHLRTHTGPNPDRVCPHCHKEFAFKATLKEHIRIHTGEKPFICQFCAKMFSHKSSLVNHMHHHDGKPESESAVSLVSNQQRKPRKPRDFLCPHGDGKAFSTNAGLQRHLLCHSSESTLLGC